MQEKVKTSKRKIKLVFVKSPNNNEMRETFRKDIEIDAPLEWRNIEILTAAVYDNVNDLSSHTDHFEDSQTFKNVVNKWSYKDESELMDKILTILDSTIEDKERRGAVKLVAKEIIYNYMKKIRRQNEKIIEANEIKQDAQQKV